MVSTPQPLLFMPHQWISAVCTIPKLIIKLQGNYSAQLDSEPVLQINAP